MSLFPLGILSAAGAGGEAATFELITSEILGSSQSSVVFDVSSYASTYKHLQLRLVTTQTPFIRFNSDTGSNYAYHRLGGAPPDAFSGAGTSQTKIPMDYVGAGGNLGSAVMDILDPFSTTKNKTTRYLGGRTASNRVAMESGLWMNTNAITSIGVIANDTNFAAGNRFSLYGVRG